MFGSIGFPEIIMIFIVVLLLFGPQKLPEFAQMFGKAIRDFRRTVNDAKSTIEDELKNADVSQDLKSIDTEIKQMANLDIADDFKEMNDELKQITKLDLEDDNGMEKEKKTN